MGEAITGKILRLHEPESCSGPQEFAFQFFKQFPVRGPTHCIQVLMVGEEPEENVTSEVSLPAGSFGMP